MLDYNEGQSVWYTLGSYFRLPAKVSGFVEGWIELTFADKSKATVPPSRVSPR